MAAGPEAACAVIAADVAFDGERELPGGTPVLADGAVEQA